MNDVLAMFAFGAGLGLAFRAVPVAWRAWCLERRRREALDRLPRYVGASFDELWQTATAMGEVSVHSGLLAGDILPPVSASVRLGALGERSEFHGDGETPTEALMQVLGAMHEATTRQLPAQPGRTFDE